MFKFFSFLFFFLVFEWSLVSQEIVNTKFYAIEEGLNTRIVRSICRSNEGLFYILAQHEVQVFDGRTIKQEGLAFPPSSTIYNSQIKTLATGEIIVLAKSNSLVYHLNEKENKLIQLDLPKLKKARVIDGVFYFMNIEGNIYKHGDTVNLIHEGGKELADFYYTEEAVYLLLSNGDLLRRSSDGKEVVLSNRVRSLEGIIRGELWTVSDYGVTMFNNESDTSVSMNGEYNRVVVRHDQKGNSLMGLSSNINRLREMYLYPADGGDRKEYHKLLDINDTVIDYYSEDFTKHILLCTYNGLIHHRVSDLIKPFHKYPQKREGSFGNLVSSIFYRSRDSSIYLMREVTGLMKLVGEKVVDVKSGGQQILYDGQKYKVYDEISDILYASSSESNLHSFHKYDFGKNDLKSIEIDIEASTLKPYTDELLILAGESQNASNKNEGAILIYDKTTDSIVFRQNFLLPNIIDVLYHRGDLYIGSNSGLYVIKYFSIKTDPQKWQLTKIDVGNTNYFHLDSLRDGRIVGSKNEKGLVIIKDYFIQKTISKEDGLCDNRIASFKFDPINNAYWLGTFNGIAVLDTSFKVLNTFLYKDGMPSSETNRFAVTEDGEGNYYYGTINGFARFNPSNLIKDGHLEKYLPEFVRYNQAKAEYRISLIDDNNRTIPYDVDDVDIHYQTRDYLTEERYQRWKYFEIRSDNKSDSFEISQGVIKAHLPESGKRKIEVFKRGDPSSIYMTMNIGKETFIESYFRIALVSLLIIGLVWMLINITKKRAVASDALKVSEADRELAEAHLHSLRSQMNPHFIFNALGSIQYYIETNKSEIATEYLSDFAMLMRLILESSKTELISFKNEIKQLKLYMALEHMRFEGQYDYDVFVDDDIDQDFLIPPMIVQPFIENAINHGLYHLTSRRGKLYVKVNYIDEETINFIVGDNGIGRAASKALRRSQHISRGMQIVDERIKALKHKSIFVDLAIKDLTGANVAAGTEVSITFKYN